MFPLCFVSKIEYASKIIVYKFGEMWQECEILEKKAAQYICLQELRKIMQNLSMTIS
jgi:hypothetical protein